MAPGSLIVVGTGIRTVGQLTTEAIAWMRIADKLLYLVSDSIAVDLIMRLNPDGAESLQGFYAEGKHRQQTYDEMVEHILARVREGHITCVASYGHPGVFAYPTHEAIRRAKAEGISARMLPGISTEDCMFADLGIDPGVHGCQSYEATDFLVNRRQIDPTSSVILWQIGALGDATFQRERYNLSALPLLVDRLCTIYPPDHTVYLYEAAILYGCEPVVVRLPIRDLTAAELSPVTTVYIPPARRPTPDLSLYNRLVALTPDFVFAGSPNRHQAPPPVVTGSD
jgi:uncharacterized protein YabN with tetrapyrrole methylase and pyrophosphatase domain